MPLCLLPSRMLKSLSVFGVAAAAATAAAHVPFTQVYFPHLYMQTNAYIQYNQFRPFPLRLVIVCKRKKENGKNLFMAVSVLVCTLENIIGVKGSE